MRIGQGDIIEIYFKLPEGIKSAQQQMGTLDKLMEEL